MKPSEEIIKIVKEFVKEDTKVENPFAGWETLEELEQVKLMSNMEIYFIKAILKYLDGERAKK